MLSGWLIGFGGIVYGQQQTGQVAPETRNPQTNSPQLFQQRSDLQTPETQSILNQDKTIQIPAGKPAAASDNETHGSSKRAALWGLIISLGLTGLGVGYVWVKWGKPEESGPVELPAEAESKPVITESPPTKKKKNTSKPKARKKRKRR